MQRIFRNNTALQAPLGRWGAILRNTKDDNPILRESSVNFNSNWANHDHCGAEACQIANNITKYKIKNTTKNGSDNKI